MKKILIMAMALVIALCSVAYAATDYTAMSDEELAAESGAINAEIQARKPASDPSDFIYGSNGQEIQLNAYVGNGGDVIIPGEINGIPVTRIGKEFMKNSKLNSIVLHEGITYIGEAFLYQAKVPGVFIFPHTVKSVQYTSLIGSTFSGVIIQSDAKITSSIYGMSKL